MSVQIGKAPYILALLLIIGGVGALIFSGASESCAYFVDVAEARTIAPEKLQGARLFGTVSAQQFVQTENGRETSFLLEDQHNKTTTMPVHFKGIAPDTFKVGAEVIVEGSMAQNGVFNAKTVMTKCPSKYQKENRKS